MLFKKDTIDIKECTQRVVFIEDENEQKAVILKYHEGKTCHRGIKETMTKIKRNYFWHNMQESISAVINSCEPCRKMKYDRNPIKPMLQLTQTQDAPFQEIFIDLFSIEGKYYLTLVDAFSKLGQAIEISNRSTPEVVRALIKYFSFYSVPRKLTSDPGSEFNNEFMRELTAMYKIELHITTPNNPNSTGIVERFHSTIIEIYRLAKYEHKFTDAASVMTYSLVAYNHTIHSATGLTPFEVVFGHTDSNDAFNANFQKTYMQSLLKDHAKRTKRLYEYISDKLHKYEEKVRKRKGGEQEVELEADKAIFTKVVNTRRSKDKPPYHKATISGEISRNVVPITVRERKTKAPIKNVKRPPQVVLGHLGDDNEGQPTSSTSKG
ncbi:jg21786 [Pararge aegeria aegeria]|uniref:RNA-directed DNA polymerase n=1 Tax=Pararge aegeria aegeria TaxID=348720 RepID=A0A8S4R1V6_9NEOP|nr:jg21786 [Pararge aegeria aegeria]